MTPATQGFRMPAEWERHEATWIAWPHHRNDWPGKFPAIAWVYADIVRAITLGERARILVRHARDEELARQVLEDVGARLEQVDFYHVPTNRIWTRDSGPTFLKNAKGETLLLDWKFNAWAKYANHKLDDKVPARVAQAIGLPVMQPMHKGRRVVLEGGAIDVNGQGMLLTTEECLLSEVQCRNPGFTREDYEQVFADWLGISQVIWLGDGVAGDDTHGHVDDLSRFVAVNTVVTVVEPDRKDVNHAPLQDNLKRLKAVLDAKGRPLNVVEIPMPKRVMFQGERLPASYANFLITNKAIITPTFNDANDRIALGILAELFSGREVLGIHATDLVWGFGTIHCLSQQQPA